MRKCIFCGKSTGFFNKYHSKCKQLHESGKATIVSLIENLDTNQISLSILKSQIVKTASDCYINENTLKDIIVKGCEKVVEKNLKNAVLPVELEDTLFDIFELFQFTPEESLQQEVYMTMLKSGVLNDLYNNKLPEINKNHVKPFNFQKEEHLVWFFQNVDYYEKRKVFFSASNLTKHFTI